MAVAFSDIGKKAKGLLGGDAATGTFQLSPKLTIASTTACGATCTLTAAQKGDKLDTTLKAAYNKGKYSLDVTADAASRLTVNGSLAEVAQGLKVGGSAVLPDPSSARIWAEYVQGSLAAKTTVGLTASPAVELAVATAVKGILVGGEVGYDTGKSAITKYNIALGYHASDFQASALITDQLSNLKLQYMHSVSPTSTVGAEVNRKLDAASDVPSTFALAYARSLANGSTAKFKLESSGTLSALYMTKLASGEKVTGSLQVQATDLSKSPLKYGFAIDLA